MGRASAIHNDIICDIILNKQQKWAYQCERLEQPRTKKQKMSSYYSNQPNANVYQAAENYYDPYSTTVPTYQPVAYSSSTAPLINIEEGKSDETNALILFIIGFFFGGIILWVCHYNVITTERKENITTTFFNCISSLCTLCTAIASIVVPERLQRLVVLCLF
jgi:hypothetical protein